MSMGTSVSAADHRWDWLLTVTAFIASERGMKVIRV